MRTVVAPRTEFYPATYRDLPRIAALEKAAHAYPWSLGNFEDSLASGYLCWQLSYGGELVGYFVVMVVVDEAHLLTIGVGPNRQGLGFGSQLLRQAMVVAQGAGCGSLLLEVRPSNERALQMYRKYGFAEIGRRRNYYPAGDGREDALVLRRNLLPGDLHG